MPLSLTLRNVHEHASHLACPKQVLETSSGVYDDALAATSLLQKSSLRKILSNGLALWRFNGKVLWCSMR